MTRILLSCLLLLSLMGAAHAQVVSLNFVSRGTELHADERAGILKASNWNNIVSTNPEGATSGTMGHLTDSDGNRTSIGVAWSVGSSHTASNTGPGPNGRMMRGWFGLRTEDNGFITVSNLSAAFAGDGYDLYVYFDSSWSGGVPRVAEYHIGGGMTRSGREYPDNFDGVFTEAKGISLADATTGNYVRFRGLTNTAISITARASQYRAAINGIQIVPAHYPVPTPQVIQFKPDPAIIQPGQQAVLDWVVSNAHILTLNPGALDVTSLTTGSVGRITVAPTNTTVYSLRGTDAGGHHIQQFATITVRDRLTLGEWRSKHFTTAELANPLLEQTLWGWTADPDGDGESNLMEMALDTDPRSSAHSAESRVRGLLTDRTEGGETNRYFSLEYRGKSYAPEIHMALVASTNLETWPGESEVQIAEVEQVEEHPDATATRLIRTTATATEFPKLFARLKAEVRSKPNVILMIADDLGVECLPAYGGISYSTPELDRLRQGGMQFTWAYGTPLCTPSRSQLLTGQYPHHTGWDIGIWNAPERDRHLEEEWVSLARMFQDAGYATATAGKWQLAHFAQTPDHPERLGFDEYCLWTWQWQKDEAYPSRYWKPHIFRKGPSDPSGQRLVLPDNVYGPDVYSEFLLDFIQRKRNERFFIYYPMTLVHSPWVATPDTIGADLDAPYETTPVKNSSDPARFASNLEYLDKLVGRLLDKLDDVGLAEETLVLFTSDNGTDVAITSQVTGGTSVPGGKGLLNDTGASVPFMVRWPGVIATNSTCNDLIDFTDLFPTLADVAGASLPAEEPGGLLDGSSFLPQLLGRPGHPRPWVYVQTGGGWFIREHDYALRNNGLLKDVRNRFAWQTIQPADDTPESVAARVGLQQWLDEVRGE